MTTDAKRAAPNCLATSGNVAATLLRSESLKVALTIAMRRDKGLWLDTLDVGLLDVVFAATFE